MEQGVMWGVIFVSYLLPYVIWHIAAEVRGVPIDEGRATRIGLCWVAGLLALLLGWYLQLNVLGAAVLLAPVALLLVPKVSQVLARFLRDRAVRIWLAGAVTWLLAIASWYAVFIDSTELDRDRVSLLATLPPLVALAGGVLFRWAKRVG